jgi:hypothetical protein
MSARPHTRSYSELQDSLDHTLGKLGLDRTITMLDIFGNDGDSFIQAPLRASIIKVFIKHHCAMAYELPESEFGHCGTQEHKECRMIGFHLFTKYNDCSYRKIGHEFGLNKRQVRYIIEQCSERLSLANTYKLFYQRYAQIEDLVFAFVTRLFKEECQKS